MAWSGHRSMFSRHTAIVRAFMWPSIYLYNVLAGFDQFANALLGGDKDQTISARIWQAVRERQVWAVYVARPVVDSLFWPWERDHCRRAYEADPERENSIWKMHARWCAGDTMVI